MNIIYKASLLITFLGYLYLHYSAVSSYHKDRKTYEQNTKNTTHKPLEPLDNPKCLTSIKKEGVEIKVPWTNYKITEEGSFNSQNPDELINFSEPLIFTDYKERAVFNDLTFSDGIPDKKKIFEYKIEPPTLFSTTWEWKKKSFEYQLKNIISPSYKWHWSTNIGKRVVWIEYDTSIFILNTKGPSGKSTEISLAWTHNTAPQKHETISCILSTIKFSDS